MGDIESENYKIGSLELYSLIEESGEGSVDILLNPSQSILQQCAPKGTFQRGVRAYLLNDNGNWSLFDTGFGRHIFQEMNALNVSLSSIENIYLTHLHPDHIGGLLSDGVAMFPNANIFLSQKEYNYWMSDVEKRRTPLQKQSYFDIARKVLDIYKEKLCLQSPIKANDLPYQTNGIFMVGAYGHTPGHVMYFVRHNDSKLLICGDLIHAIDVQVLFPEISVTYDVDPVLAMETRIYTFDYIANSNIPIAGVHIAYGGVVAINKDGHQYSYSITKQTI